MDGQFFGLKDDQLPLIFIQNSNGQKYLKPNVEPENIGPWLKEYTVRLLFPSQIDSKGNAL